MRSAPVPAPWPTRIGLFLIYALIFLRFYLIQGAINRFADTLQQGGPEGMFDLLLNSRAEGSVLVPGSLGNPVLFLLLIPFLIALRRLSRLGYGWAARAFLVYLALRALLIVARGPHNRDALILMALMTSIAMLLALPTSRQWFRDCAQFRRDRRGLPA